MGEKEFLGPGRVGNEEEGGVEEMMSADFMNRGRIIMRKM